MPLLACFSQKRSPVLRLHSIPSMGPSKPIDGPSMVHRWAIDGPSMAIATFSDGHRWTIDGHRWDLNYRPAHGGSCGAFLG